MLQQAIIKNRYPGVKPFQSDEKELFFGRELDVEDLHSLIFIRQTVVLYGKSGYGKSSLINAGIIPKLNQEKTWVYFVIRFNNFSQREQEKNLAPADNLRMRISRDIDEEVVSPLDKLIPHENSFWYWVKTYQYMRPDAQFILFFDQFEELFTYPKSEIEDFSEQLSQLLYSVIPVKFRAKLVESDKKDELTDELHSFIYEKPVVKVVFSIRSDRLSLLNSLTDRHPAILQTCHELDALTIEQAKKAITEPASLDRSSKYLTPAFSFTEDAVQKIIAKVASQQDNKIELAPLQIVCRYVEDELVNGKKRTKITSELLGDITAIFKRYYETILNKLSIDDRVKTQRLIEDELLEGGRRIPLSEEYIQSKFGISEALLQQLESSSLLRKERDAANRILVELSHDALLIPVTEAKKRRLLHEQEEKIRKENEEKRKLAAELQMLDKARQLGGVDRQAFEINKRETLKKNYKLFFIQSRLMAVKKNMRAGLIVIFILLFLVFCVIWSGIATYKFIHKDYLIEKNAKNLEEVNQGFQRVIRGYDSVSNPAGYNELKNLLQKYEGLKKP